MSSAWQHLNFSWLKSETALVEMADGSDQHQQWRRPHPPSGSDILDQPTLRTSRRSGDADPVGSTPIGHVGWTKGSPPVEPHIPHALPAYRPLVREGVGHVQRVLPVITPDYYIFLRVSTNICVKNK
eukprot:1317828-Rhodomonas_salina.7